jgi:uncharacterized membrane protein YgdD (TMEM256/DUF423 family)
MVRTALLIACLLGFASVAAGAFGAHALRERLEPRMLEIFETAVRYQFFHALALMGAAWIASQTRWPGVANAAIVLFIVGTVIFSGSLYVLVATGVRAWGAVTPIGGVALLAGWACLGAAAWAWQR